MPTTMLREKCVQQRPLSTNYTYTYIRNTCQNASSGGREDNGGATAAAGGSGKWAVTPTTPTATSGVTHAPPLPLPLPLLDVMKAAVTASASDPALRWTHQWNRRMKPLVLNMIFERLQGPPLVQSLVRYVLFIALALAVVYACLQGARWLH